MDEERSKHLIDVERLVDELKDRVEKQRAAGAYADDLSGTELQVPPPAEPTISDTDARVPRVQFRPELGSSSKPVIGPVITLVKRFILRLIHFVLDDLARQADAAIARVEAGLTIETAARERQESKFRGQRATITAEIVARERVAVDVKSLAGRLSAVNSALELQLTPRLARLEQRLHELETEAASVGRAETPLGDRRALGIARQPVAPWGTERVVEVPWVLSRYRGERRVLDIGSAFAEAAYVEQLAALQIPELVGVDLAAPAQATAPPFEVVRGDVRALPFADESFELVLCVSTLEHIGCDNSIYGLSAEHDASGMVAALNELRRVLVPAGRLLVTVPCGEPEDHGWFVQKPVSEWRTLFRAASFTEHDQQVFELHTDGWHWTRRLHEHGVRYYARGPAASAVLCAELVR